MAKTAKVKGNNFMGAGVADHSTSGRTPNESAPMGMYWGTGIKNPMGRLRDSSVGYRPVSPHQLGNPPKSVV